MDNHRPPEFHSSFYGARYWATWLLLCFFRVCARLPISVNMVMGRFIGMLFHYLGGSRRRIAKTNIALCFPELSAADQRRMVRGVMRSCGISIMESAMGLWGRTEKLRNHHVIQGLEHIKAAQESGQGILLLGCHLTTMDIAGRALSYYCQPDLLYRKDPNPLLAYQLIKARTRYLGEAIVRSDTRQLIKRLRQGHIVWYAPDQDYGRKHSIFAPFFGLPAATVVATAKIAQLGKAIVLPYAHYRDEVDGKLQYRLVISPALHNFPSGDDLQDATRINQLVESMIREKPDQYLWVHRRFKTRPNGEIGFYTKKKKNYKYN